MQIAIRHQLSLPATSGTVHVQQHLLLTPFSGPTQTVKEWTLAMPGIETAARFTDAFGNRALLVTQIRPEDAITLSITGRVDTIDRNGVLGRVPGEPVVALYRRMTPLTQPDPRIVEAFADADRSGVGRIALLHGVMERLGELYRFGPATAVARQTQRSDGQTQSQGSAEPDDRPEADAASFTHAFIGAVRALDIPARYVTGYLVGDDEQPAAFHAWAEAYDDGLGWIAFDAALGVCPTDRHVRVAAGLDALSTMPVRIVPHVGEPMLVEISAEAAAAQ